MSTKIMCPFCNLEHSQVLFSTEHYWVIRDRAPVTRGHSLIILKRHHAEPFSLSTEEWDDLRIALEEVKATIDSEFHPDGYNIGINSGVSAGQTVPHLHVHVIPRYAGDVEDPRGGIRNLIKPLEELWPE